MDGELMGRCCPDHRYLGVASLDGYRLSFRRRSLLSGGGVADVLESPGHRVWGALYELTNADLRALDFKEAAGNAYRRQLHTVKPLAAPALEAILYTVIDKTPEEVMPTDTYRSQLLSAAAQRALPTGYIAWLTDLTIELCGSSTGSTPPQ
jgi:gamma-glutamylcyclotransferase (GGCT)/AIG2-like uncharacterized protein YtfP